MPVVCSSTLAQGIAFGLTIYKRVIGDEMVHTMCSNAPADYARIQRAISGSCSSDRLASSGIDLPTNELLTFAMLIALGCYEQHVVGQTTRETALSVLAQLPAEHRCPLRSRRVES